VEKEIQSGLRRDKFRMPINARYDSLEISDLRFEK